MKLFDRERKPIENVQLSTRHIALRWFAVAVCLIVAVVTIGYALNALLTVNAGWQEIEDISSGLTCANDFVVSYNFGEGGAEATTTYRRIAALYSEAAEKAYWLFTKDQAHETIVGMRAINDAPNAVLTVDKVLYDAFALVQEYGDRSIYLAPLYAEHDSMLSCETEIHAKMRDPAFDADAAEYAARVALYANDPQHINVELLENNQIRLHVSEEYLNWAQDNAVDTLIDFHWMKNAFILDYFAELLTQNGYTQGAISSVDGYVRNLGDTGSAYRFNVYDCPDHIVRLAAVMQYQGKKSIVSLRTFPISEADAAQRYYVYEDGTSVAPYMNAQTGLRASAAPFMVGYAQEIGCAEVLLRMLPVYTVQEDVRTLVQKDVHAVWCEEKTVYHTEEALKLLNLYQNESMIYQSKYFD